MAGIKGGRPRGGRPVEFTYFYTKALLARAFSTTHSVVYITSIHYDCSRSASLSSSLLHTLASSCSAPTRLHTHATRRLQYIPHSHAAQHSCKRPHARPDRSVTSKEEDLIRCPPPHTKNSLVAHDIELYCSWLSERNESTCETYTSKLLPGRITTPVRAVPSTTISSGASVWMCRTYCVP